MNFPQLLQTIGISILTNAVVVGVAVLVIRSWVDNIFSRDLEKFKADLQKERETHVVQLKAGYDHQLELFKKQLEQTALEHQVRFTKLHEKRAEVIAELYRLLANTEREADTLISQAEFEAEYPFLNSVLKAGTTLTNGGSAFELADQFHNYFDENRIYLDDQLCNQMLALESMLKSVHIALIRYKWSRRQSEDSQVGVQEPKVDWGELKQLIPPIRKEIERRFREILGV